MAGAMGPLGLALRNVLGGAMATQQPSPQPAMPTPYKPSRGQLIAGILGDALEGAMGRPGTFAAQMGQVRQQEREQAQWGMRRTADLEDYAKKQEIDQRYQTTKPYRWEANDGSLMELGADGAARQLYKDPTPKAGLDPDVFITLPNGQVYAGPKSGLAGAMMGGVPAVTPPLKPKGKLTPINGGPTPQASGTFLGQ